MNYGVWQRIHALKIRQTTEVQMNNFIKRAEQRLLQGPVQALGSHVSKDQWQPSQSDKKRTRKIRHYQNPLKSEFSPALPNEDLTSVCIMCPEMTFKDGLQTP